MEKELKKLVIELKEENQELAIAMNSGCLSDYAHTVMVVNYNNTLNIIKRIEAIIN